MKYLNVTLTGLGGRHHPALLNIITTIDVKKSRIHIKMLAGDYLTYVVRSKHSFGGAHCHCCTSLSPTPPPLDEDLPHILASCAAYTDIRERFTTQYNTLCDNARSPLYFQEICNNTESFCQFILDPGSFNLPNRIHINDPILGSLFQLSRDYCYAVNSARMKILTEKLKK